MDEAAEGPWLMTATLPQVCVTGTFCIAASFKLPVCFGVLTC